LYSDWVKSVQVKDSKISIQLVLVIVAVVIVTLLICFLVFILIKRCQRHKIRKNRSQETLLDIDDQKWQIEKVRIDQMYLIGKGHFGEVHKGILKPKHGSTEQNEIVAIKTLKFEKDDELTDYEFMARKSELEKGFMDEARRMSKLETHHIVELKGYWLADKPYMVVMEFMEFGDLKSFLRRNRVDQSVESENQNGYQNIIHSVSLSENNKVKIRPLIHMALEIADGMAYLEKMKYVHRDLAARNCMVSSDFTIKIGDFGLSRFIDTSDYYMTQPQGHMPYRWLAPESLSHGKFCSKSDVYSYGILLWELVNFGETPFPVSEFII
jgi:serine/threonine protein kinase